jgi:predicted O-methyltransferase YrrM
MNLKTPKIDAYFSSPVKHGVNGKKYRLNETSVDSGEALSLHGLIAESGARRVMEIGLALGGSAVAIAEALEQRGEEGHLVTLDPFQEAFGKVGLRELERLGLSRRVEFLPAYAEDYLSESARCGRQFDFIFIDGAHSIGNKMTNTFFADRCLSTEGILAFHDAFMASTVACVTYLVKERGYEPITLAPDSAFKRRARTLKYWSAFGQWYVWSVVPHTHRSLVALRRRQFN